MSPYVGDPHVIAIELQLAGIRLGSAALTEESALDLALRLVGTVMKRRRAARVRSGRAAIEYVPSSAGVAGDRRP